MSLSLCSFRFTYSVLVSLVQGTLSFDCSVALFSAGSIPGFVRYRSIPSFCSILDTYVVHVCLLTVEAQYAREVVLVRYQNSSISIDIRFLFDTRNLPGKFNSVYPRVVEISKETLYPFRVMPQKHTQCSTFREK